jgi:diguanylate cyclase (GGDEF)-like protein/PAS domain S-box-containing protein
MNREHPTTPQFDRRLLEELPLGAYVMNKDGTVGFWNHQAELISGFPADEVVGNPCAGFFLAHVNEQGETLCDKACPMQQSLADGKVREADVFLHHSEGHRVPVHVKIVPLLDSAGAVAGVMQLFRDETPLTAAREEIRTLQLATMTDALTGMPNRRYMEMTLERSLDEFRRTGRRFGVIVADIDQFKQINDRHGHHFGDRAIRMAGASMACVCRTYDAMGRWGGDEFLGVSIVSDGAALSSQCERMRAMVEQSFLLLENRKVSVTVSLGAALCQRGDDAQQLVRRADEQMYKSKAARGNAVTLSPA